MGCKHFFIFLFHNVLIFSIKYYNTINIYMYNLYGVGAPFYMARCSLYLRFSYGQCTTKMTIIIIIIINECVAILFPPRYASATGRHVCDTGASQEAEGGKVKDTGSLHK